PGSWTCGKKVWEGRNWILTCGRGLTYAFHGSFPGSLLVQARGQREGKSIRGIVLSRGYRFQLFKRKVRKMEFVPAQALVVAAAAAAPYTAAVAAEVGEEAEGELIQPLSTAQMGLTPPSMDSKVLRLDGVDRT
ncbi:unnamed protein product, partial [Phaeothamnion confervicola]